jgi:uncharacterized protein with von Willebrand factor type A (vWA) domain
MSEMLDKLKELLSDPVRVAKMKEDFARKIEVNANQFDRVQRYIDSIPVDQFEARFEQFLKWEEEWEEDQYVRNHCMTSSRIFGQIIKVLESRGTSLRNRREDFFSGGFKWGKYTFKLYCGQGCFWRILKGRKIIFQTT